MAKAKVICDDAERRLRPLTLVAVLFVFAQFVFAAHAGAKADYLLDHSPASCVVCIAGAASDDPAPLVVNVVGPVRTAGEKAEPAPQRLIAAPTVLSAQARAPPFC